MSVSHPPNMQLGTSVDQCVFGARGCVVGTFGGIEAQESPATADRPQEYQMSGRLESGSQAFNLRRGRWLVGVLTAVTQPGECLLSRPERHGVVAFPERVDLTGDSELEIVRHD